MDIRSTVECFHLLFLSFLGQKLDKKLYALKGGCNLRFFFQSPRYSEDIDLNVATVAVGTLKKKIDDIFLNRSFKDVLRSHSLTIEEWSAPKQTETVQRWKARIRNEFSGTSVPTKIEFSRRSLQPGSENEPVDALLLGKHRLPLILIPHYPMAIAIRQKISALIHRSQTQARDLFDIDWLTSRSNIWVTKSDFSNADITKAIDNAISISFRDFQGQVGPYLDSNVSDVYTEAYWNILVDRIITRLEALQS